MTNQTQNREQIFGAFYADEMLPLLSVGHNVERPICFSFPSSLFVQGRDKPLGMDSWQRCHPAPVCKMKGENDG